MFYFILVALLSSLGMVGALTIKDYYEQKGQRMFALVYDWIALLLFLFALWFCIGFLMAALL